MYTCVWAYTNTARPQHHQLALLSTHVASHTEDDYARGEPLPYLLLYRSHQLQCLRAVSATV